MDDYLLSVVRELWPHYEWTVVAGSMNYYVLFSGYKTFSFSVDVDRLDGARLIVQLRGDTSYVQYSVNIVDHGEVLEAFRTSALGRRSSLGEW